MNECSICFENLEKNKYVIILNCNHIFHKKCITKWFSYTKKKQYNKCPICNRKSKIQHLNIDENINRCSDSNSREGVAAREDHTTNWCCFCNIS